MFDGMDVVAIWGAEQCARCRSARNTVTDSRPTIRGRLRRRECDDCGERWSTLEVRKPGKDRQPNPVTENILVSVASIAKSLHNIRAILHEGDSDDAA